MSDMENAYQEGWSAYWSHEDIDSNPYNDLVLSEEWAMGWLTAQRADKVENG